MTGEISGTLTDIGGLPIMRLLGDSTVFVNFDFLLSMPGTRQLKL